MNRGDYLKNNVDIAKKIGSVGGKSSKRGKENWSYKFIDNFTIVIYKDKEKSPFNYRGLVKYLKIFDIPDLPKSSIEFKRKYGQNHTFKIKEIESW